MKRNFYPKHTLLVSAVLLTAALCFAGCADTNTGDSLPAPSQPDNCDPPTDNTIPVNSYDPLTDHTILVNSSEHISVVPDIAEVVYSVRTENKSAAACQQNNADAAAQVIELLKSLGVQEASIQTSDYYMHPVYNYSGNTAKIAGYEAATSLTVSNLPIDGLGDLLAQSVSSGVNTIQSITYQASKYDESYQEALTAAVSSAYQKARTLAAAAGCEVGPVINIQETSGYSQARYTDYARANQLNSAKEEALMSDYSAAQILPGEIEVEAKILIEYQLISSGSAPSAADQ